MFKKNYLYGLLLMMIMVASCSKSDKPAPAVTQNDIATIDNKVAAFMTTYSVPGASLAISKNGKLVYRKGYGFADKETNQKVTVNDRFRVASVSKTITAVAIMKLVQDGKLTIDQKVFGTGAILGTEYGTAPYSTRVANITVKDLLHHTTGGWNNAWPQDPVFQQPAATAKELITWTLNNRTLTNDPGTSFQYSNFGYLVLGRIIEKISGKTYEQYVKESILTPIQAKNTEIAGNTLADRKPNEVKYYGQGSEATYVYTDPWKRNDAPSGWISTPTDLVRLLTAIDSSATRPDILNGATLKLMRTPNTINNYYACGIYVGAESWTPSNWYHFGSLPGTQALIFKTSTGWSVAFAINTRFTNANTSQNAFAQMLIDIVTDNSIPWQDIDQF